MELFKFRSLSGFVICRCGGPVAWKAVRQQKSAQLLDRSCEAEIVATNKCVGELMSIRYRAMDLDRQDEVSGPTTIYNDNQACVSWSASLTTKRV